MIDLYPGGQVQVQVAAPGKTLLQCCIHTPLPAPPAPPVHRDTMLTLHLQEARISSPEPTG